MAVKEAAEALENNGSLYKDEKERQLHYKSIEIILQKSEASEEEIERLYRIVLLRFKREANVKDFLPILVARRVEYLLEIRRRSGKDK
jgi:hypothetical protein